MKKIIITVVGKRYGGDHCKKVCTYLANNQVNILDISQTIVQGYFNMMMVDRYQQIQQKHLESCPMSCRQILAKKSVW
ncbi:MAG: hypothetical protein V8S32_01875 [Lachnospiraceae bacterium]